RISHNRALGRKSRGTPTPGRSPALRTNAHLQVSALLRSRLRAGLRKRLGRADHRVGAAPSRAPYSGAPWLPQARSARQAESSFQPVLSFGTRGLTAADW